jgi:Domain of unknown function (DUF4388)
MERLEASLAHYRLPLIVPALLDRTLLTGTLRLERGAIRRAFHFRDGFLVAESSNEPREHLAQVLSQLNILDVETSAAAFEAARGVGLPLGAFLIERGFVPRPRLVEALSHKAQEAFFDCYTWDSGELGLVPDELPDDLGVSLRLPLGALHRDALARLREWRTFRQTFPSNDCTFRVHRHIAVDWRSATEEELVVLAEKGATLGELLTSGSEGQLVAARRLVQLYRRGVLSPRMPQRPVIGDAPDLSRLIALARTLLSEEKFEAAAAVAAQAIESAPCPEASTLYREAEERMGSMIGPELAALEGRVQVEALPHPLPSQITAADLYFHSLLRSSPSLRHALSRSPAGELAAFHSLRRLMSSGLVRINGDAARPRPTVPYGLPALRT